MKNLYNPKRIITLFILCFCFTFGLVMAQTGITKNASALETDASVTSAIKMTIDTQNSQYSADLAGIGDDAYIIFAVAPFPIVNDTDRSFKNNAFADWWNPWGEVEITYDFYSPNYIAGMGGIGLEFNDYTVTNNNSYLDKDGYKSICTDSQYVQALGNGWYRRTMVCTATTNVIELYLLFGVKKGDLPTSGVLDMYYTNFKLKYGTNGVTYNVYGNDSSVYKNDGVNKVAAGEAYAAGCTVKAAEITVNTAWGYMESFMGTGAAANKSLGVTFGGVAVPSVCSVATEMPEFLYVGTEYNMLGYATSTGTTAISGYSVDGVAQEVTGVDFSKFTPASAGSYIFAYTATKDGYTAVKNVEITVATNTKPVFNNDDITEAVPTTGYAHQAINLGKVLATVENVKDLVALPHITNSNGDVIAYTATENGYTFTPTEKKNDVYTVYYIAQKNDDVVNSIAVDITVTDIDKPVIDFSAVTDFNVGSFYTVENLINLLSITDISDGNIEVDSVSVVDPFGNNLIEESTEKFMVRYTGEYVISVTSCADTDGNSTSSQVSVDGIQSKGLVLGVEVSVDEASRGAGVNKFFNTQIYNIVPTLALNVGDTISYDVMAYTEYSDGTIGFISGVGGISGQIDGSYAGLSWPFMHTLFDSKECLDEAGYSMSQSADLTDVLQEDGNAVWYSRAYKVASGDAIFSAGWYHFGISLNTTDACGEKIIVYYKNIKVLNADGEVKADIWDGTQQITRAYTENTNCSGVAYATLDVSPVVIEGKIPSTAEYNQEISISKNLMKDALTDTIIDVDITVKAPDGANVVLQPTLTGYSFTADKLGKYTVNILGSNGTYATEKEYTITVADSVAPSITIVSPETLTEGDEVVFTITITDNVSDMSNFYEVGCTLQLNNVDADGAVITKTETGYTVSFTVAVGSYRLLVYATDGSKNETVESVPFTGVAKTQSSDGNSDTSSTSSPAKGCGGAMGGSSVALAVLFIGLCVAKKRKSN